MATEMIGQSGEGVETLEAEVWRDEANTEGLGVMLAHPHGKFGGNMHNNVVKALFEALVQTGTFRMVVRFNFRGIGKSTGSPSWTGVSERRDIGVIAEFLSCHGSSDEEECAKRRPFVIVGYSFGSAVGSGMAEELRSKGCVGFVAISYPVGWSSAVLFRSHYRAAAESTLPKLFLSGTADNFTWVSTLRSWFAKAQQPKELLVLEGMDHFWFGQEHWLIVRVIPWIQRIGRQQLDLMAASNM